MTSFAEQICKRQLRYIDVEHFDKRCNWRVPGVGLYSLCRDDFVNTS